MSLSLAGPLWRLKQRTWSCVPDLSMLEVQASPVHTVKDTKRYKNKLGLFVTKILPSVEGNLRKISKIRNGKSPIILPPRLNHDSAAGFWSQFYKSVWTVFKCWYTFKTRHYFQQPAPNILFLFRALCHMIKLSSKSCWCNTATQIRLWLPPSHLRSQGAWKYWQTFCS